MYTTHVHVHNTCTCVCDLTTEQNIIHVHGKQEMPIKTEK